MLQTFPTSEQCIRVLIIDSAPIVRTGISTMLRSDQAKPSFQTAEADDLPGGLEKVSKSNFQIVLVEESLLNGDDAMVRAITRLSSSTRLIIMGLFPDARFVSGLLEQGVHAFIPRTISVKELKAAIASVLHNEPYICSRAAHILFHLKRESLPVRPKISHRESEILLLIVSEKTTSEIARLLVVAQSTVETHRRNLMLKLHVKNTAGLVRAAYEYNLLTRQ